MKKRMRILMLLALPAILFSLLGFMYVTTATADPASPDSYQLPQRWEYTAKFLCGSATEVPQGPAQPDVVSGTYATVVNIHNPNAATVTILKKVVVAYPETFPVSTAITPTKRFRDRIQSDFAMSVNCQEIVNLLSLNKTPPTSPFIEGYLVVDALPVAGTAPSLPQLDVDAVYSAAPSTAAGGPAGVSTTQVDHISGRVLPAGMWPF